MTTPHYAAIDATNITGAVYGVGTTPASAREQADAGDPHASGRGTYALVPCTPAAGAYVDTYGGAPSRDLTVTRDGVCLRDEE